MIETRRTTGWKLVGVLSLVSLVAGGCGSQLTHAEFRNANAELLRPTEGARASADQGIGAPAPGAPEPGAPASPSSDPTAPSAANTPTSAGGATSAISRPASESAAAPTGGPARAAGTTAAGASPSPARGGRPAPAGSKVTPVPGGPGAAPAPAAAGPKSEILLGSVGTDSGPAGLAIAGMLPGARAWVADVNSRGGLNGHPVRTIVADDGGDPGKALALVKRMVEVDKVQAFYATRGFLNEQAYIPYLEERGIPIIVTCACNPVDGVSPMTFDPYITELLGGVWMHLGPLLTQTDKRKIALLYCREASICVAIRNEIKKQEQQLGIKIVFETQDSIAQPDYTAEIVSARNSGAEAVVSINDIYTNIRILRTMRRQGWDAPYASQFSNHDDNFLKEGGQDVDGMLLAGAVANYDSSPKMADFRAAMARYSPGKPLSDFGAGAWLGGKLLEKIAARFRDTVTTRDILDGLYSLKQETLDGRIAPTTYPVGRHDRVNLCIIPLTIRSGKFVPKNGDEFSCQPGWQPG